MSMYSSNLPQTQCIQCYDISSLQMGKLRHSEVRSLDTWLGEMGLGFSLGSPVSLCAAIAHFRKTEMGPKGIDSGLLFNFSSESHFFLSSL